MNDMIDNRKMTKNSKRISDTGLARMCEDSKGSKHHQYPGLLFTEEIPRALFMQK